LSSIPPIPSQLLFLPGALGNRDFWEPLASKLPFQAERVFVAYPGFAGMPPDPAITCFDHLVDSVVSRIDRPTALIAQSMGGVLAIEATIRKPSLITHLVLVATSGGLDTSTLGAADWRQSVKQDHPDLPNWFTSYNSDLTPELSSISVPVLLVWGDCDPISPIAVGRELLSRFPNAELHIVPRGKHDVARTNAECIVPLIEAQLQNRSSFNSKHRDRG
jgi:poly(3-hydroxyoctanoate) depolymerase